MSKKKKIMRGESKLCNLELTLRDVIELFANGLKIQTCTFGYISKKKHGGYYDTAENEILINTKEEKWGKRRGIIHELYHALCNMHGIRETEKDIIALTKKLYDKLYNQTTSKK